MFVTMNRFTIDPDHWGDFEARFRQRAGLVDGEPGFIRNALLRPVESSGEQHIVMTLWESRQDFENWTRSESFVKAHQRARETPREWFIAPTRLEVFESADQPADAENGDAQDGGTDGAIIAGMRGENEQQEWIEAADDALRESIIRHEGDRDVIYAMLEGGSLNAARGCDWRQCRDEGTWPAYVDSKGLDTVGIGHLITGNEAYDAYAGVPDAEVQAQFEQDVQTHLSAAKRLAEEQGMRIAGNFVIQRFMTEMCFNIGEGKYRGFRNGLKKLASAVNGDGRFTYNQAADEHLDSQWARQVKTRATEMTDMLRALDRQA